ncbi:MAG: PIN domain-containing protein [Candidatus Thiothrix moscowensis]|nr:PIN domain-containing protein [Candidatus Thiothrix moscowensis]
MYLVDTSLWIDYINGKEGEHIAFLDTLLQNPLVVGITDVIYMEILQGAENERHFTRFRDYFSSQRFYQLQQAHISHEQAARIYFDCRRKGITVRSTIDCLIAQCAIENNLVLLHHDRDFKQMGTVISNLNQRHFLPDKPGI